MYRKSIIVRVEPAVLKWLRESSGWTIDEVSKLLGVQKEHYLKIEKGEKNLTFRQIELLAKKFRRPSAAFLLPAPPQEPPLPKDFRLIPNDKKEFSKKMRLAFRQARLLQDSSMELMINLGFSIEPNLKKYTLSDNPVNVAAKEREASGITLQQQMKWKDSYKAFSAWRDYIEEKNIRVFQISMPPEEARGFSLKDKKPYVIVLNTADDINARIFTLFHEYAHLLLSKTSETSVCITDPLAIDSNETAKIERWCNQFAAEFLLPEQSKQQLPDKIQILQDKDFGILDKYASKFKVSKYALLVRMKEFNIITESELKQLIKSLKQIEPNKDSFGRGLTQLDKCYQEKGRNYISLVLENLDKGFINTLDALDYLSIQMKYLDALSSGQRGVKRA